MAPSKQITSLRKCARCPTMIEIRPNGLYCDSCKKAAKKEQNASHASQTAEYRRRKAAEKLRTPKKKVLVTEEEQKAIDRAVDNKHSVDQTVRRYFKCERATAELFRQYSG